LFSILGMLGIVAGEGLLAASALAMAAQIRLEMIVLLPLLLLTPRGLEIEKIRQFDDKRALDRTALRVAPVVVNEVQVAQRMVNEIETDIRTDLVCIGVVLKKCIEKQAWRKSVEEPGTNQHRGERAIRQMDAVVAVVYFDVQMMVRFPNQTTA
jgi:hypothetical protein